MEIQGHVSYTFLFATVMGVGKVRKGQFDSDPSRLRASLDAHIIPIQAMVN